MLDQLYKKQLASQRKIKDDPVFDKTTFTDSTDEYSWKSKVFFDRKGQSIGTPYGSIYDNSCHVISDTTWQPHGNFKSDYPFFRQWRKDVGGGGVGVDLARPPTKPSKRSIYACSTPTAMWVGGYSNGLTVLNEVKDSASNALVDKLKRDLPEWDLLTEFAELGETLGFCKETSKRMTDIVAGCLLRNPRRVLRGFMVDPTKKRVRHVKSVIDHKFATNSDASIASLKAAGSLWLTYRYGLMPLLYSAEDAIKALSFSGKKSTIYTEAQVTFYQKYTISDRQVDGLDSSSLMFIKLRQFTKGYFSYRLKARMSWSDSFASRLKLNPLQVASTAWELVPFSFVVDWFTDVNGWLTRLQVATLASSIKITGTLKDQCTAGEIVFGVQPVYNDSFNKYSFTYLGKAPMSTTRTFQREANLSINVRPPSLENGLTNFKRHMDSIALALNFVKSPSLRKVPS